MWLHPARLDVIVLSDYRRLFGGDPFPFAVALPEAFGRRKPVEGKLLLIHAPRCGAVMLDEGIAVGAVNKGDVEGYGVADYMMGLLFSSTVRMAPAISLIRIGFITSALMPFSLARR
jgi:hypothetical protein